MYTYSFFCHQQNNLKRLIVALSYCDKQSWNLFNGYAGDNGTISHFYTEYDHSTHNLTKFHVKLSLDIKTEPSMYHSLYCIRVIVVYCMKIRMLDYL